MKIQISGVTEFEAFVQEIEDGQEAVALQNPYTDIQIVSIAKNLIESTDFYTMDCREWNRTDKAQKTWVDFKLHFRGHSGKTGTSLYKLNMQVLDSQTKKNQQTPPCSQR